MDWKENEKGNLLGVTPSGTSLVIFKRLGEYSWSATRKYEDKARFSDVSFGTREEAQRDLMSRTDMAASPPPPPVDYFNVEGVSL